MATILLHAGMPKAGSTAVQEFLRKRADQLASKGIVIARARRTPRGPSPIEVRRFDTGSVTSGPAISLMLDQPDTKPAVMQALIQGFERLSQECETLVLTGESLTQLLWRSDPEVLAPLDELAARHSVRVVYYVRPQHTALEAAWRQWGFRTGQRPARFLERRAEQVYYLETLQAVRSTAPGIKLVVRPFRSDLLDGGDVVVDFAGRFLGLAADSVPSSSDNRANVGLPLEITNLLSCAPLDFLGRTPHDNRRFETVKRLLGNVSAAPSPLVQEGQQILQGWCHQRFESSNRELIRQMGWSTDAFVPPTGETVEDLRPLDTLWRPSASPMEVAAFFRLLELHLASGAEQRSPSAS